MCAPKLRACPECQLAGAFAHPVDNWGLAAAMGVAKEAAPVPAARRGDFDGAVEAAGTAAAVLASLPDRVPFSVLVEARAYLDKATRLFGAACRLALADYVVAQAEAVHAHVDAPTAVTVPSGLARPIDVCHTINSVSSGGHRATFSKGQLYVRKLA
jgi:hypothetical protein